MRGRIFPELSLVDWLPRCRHEAEALEGKRCPRHCRTAVTAKKIHPVQTTCHYLPCCRQNVQRSHVCLGPVGLPYKFHSNSFQRGSGKPPDYVFLGLRPDELKVWLTRQVDSVKQKKTLHNTLNSVLEDTTLAKRRIVHRACCRSSPRKRRGLPATFFPAQAKSMFRKMLSRTLGCSGKLHARLLSHPCVCICWGAQGKWSLPSVVHTLFAQVSVALACQSLTPTTHHVQSEAGALDHKGQPSTAVSMPYIVCSYDSDVADLQSVMYTKPTRMRL